MTTARRSAALDGYSFFANSFKTLRNEEEAFAASRFCNREVKSKKRSIKGCIVPKSPLSLPTDHFDVGAVHLS